MTVNEEIRAAALQAVVTVQAGAMAGKNFEPLGVEEFRHLVQSYENFIRTGEWPDER